MFRLLFLSVMLAGLAGYPQSFNGKAIKDHIGYLASDKLEGRGTGTAGEKKAADYIEKQFKKLRLAPLNGNYQTTFEFRDRSDPHDTVGKGALRKGTNVAAFLDNKAELTVVIGAHYDHLGLGHDHNSLDANPEGKIHNGADDNASGTAGVIELASYFSNNKVKEPFNFLFVCFSGEELGLIGSKKFYENSPVPLSKINYMINMDMIGRLNDSTMKLIVYGVGTSPTFVPLLDSVQSRLSLKKDSSGIGPSDQTSFYLRDIPVLHFFTGQHSDYHKPGDDPHKINLDGEVEVLKFIAAFVEKTYRYPKLQFSKTRSPESSKVSFKVTMGVMPDYAFEGPGMRIDGVTDNKPAAKAGIKKGDVVMKLGGQEVKDVMGYMKVLSGFKKGDSTVVEVMREGILLPLNITF